jgi:nucleoside-diphosphate-sugar epimerase
MMNIFVTGATGVLGTSLVPRLVEAGYTVWAMNLTLWIIAGLLAAVFLVAGTSKLFIPQEKLAKAPEFRRHEFKHALGNLIYLALAVFVAWGRFW